MNLRKNKMTKQSAYKQDFSKQSMYRQGFSWPDDAPVWEEESEELINNLDELRKRSKE